MNGPRVTRLGLSATVMLVLTWPVAVGAWQIEAANVTLINTLQSPVWTSVSFRQTYPVPPVVVAIASQRGGNPTALRFRNITTTGFEVAQVEPNGNDGPHLDVEIFYIAAEPGVHAFPDGSLIEAGFVSTSAVQHGAGVAGTESWTTVNFAAPFPQPPAVLADLRTVNNETGNPPGGSSIPWLTVALDNVSAASVDVALERSESSAGSVVTSETIGYLAIEDNALGNFFDSGGATINYEAFVTPSNIRGWSQGCSTNTYNGSYSSPPLFVAAKNTRNEDDGGWFRWCQRNTGSFGVRIDEDQDRDGERNHVNEVGGVAVFSQPFDASFLPDILMLKTSAVTSDPYSGTVNPKAIPGAISTYTLIVTNQGIGSVDANSVLVTDPIPTFGRMMVTDIGAPGSGPVQFSQGSPASGVTYTYLGLGSGADSLEFSNNGGASFTYSPMADANGTDTAVTHVRVRTSGIFVGRTGATAPSFRVAFRIQVD